MTGVSEEMRTFHICWTVTEASDHAKLEGTFRNQAVFDCRTNVVVIPVHINL